MYYTFDSRKRYSEVDAEGLLRMDALVQYFQDCSTFQSEDGGVGIGYMQDNDAHWLVNYYQIDASRLPVYGERVRIGTVPYEQKSFLGIRNFFMETEAGERLAVANSVWSLINMERMKPVMVPQKMLDCYVIHDRLEMDYKPRKMKVPEGPGKAGKPIEVTETHMDSNRHVNNVQYVRFAMDMVPEGSLITGLRIEYKKQAKLGDIITPVCWENGGLLVTSLNGEDGTPFALTEMKVRERTAAETDAWRRLKPGEEGPIC
jgi:medium-chain acyl-[acyl-carrier-protein] hydrolase